MARDWLAPLPNGYFGVVASLGEDEFFAFGFGNVVESFNEVSPLHKYYSTPIDLIKSRGLDKNVCLL